jgi:hypothetical protein
MSTTLRAQSFADINIREHSALAANAAVGATTLTFESTEGFLVGDIVYLGALSQEGCERVVIATVPSATSVTASATTLPHFQFDPVTSVVGDKVRIYRAANVDGTAPDDGDFAFLANRTIQPDKQSTYYIDATGSSDYWYKLTYFNATSLDETDIDASTAARGDDFGHYASLTAIRKRAGFEGAVNLGDDKIDQHRRAAEAEINTTLGGAYTVPFTAPVPDQISTLTIDLAAGLLLDDAFSGSSAQGTRLIKDTRAALLALANRTGTLPDGSGQSGEVISSWPDDTTADTDVVDGGGARMFHVGDTY